ncbi:MAG TPA: cyclic nucleotide-binding domain-containing protein [Vicinamibacteria bacterium]|nr:cyclic nucleotide-binding domain-containing protein [Vicinamibacteria bacterium]
MGESAQDLIAKKQYAKAVELLQKGLKARPKDQRLRLQLADTLVLAGRGRDAAPILMGLADEHAQDGFGAKSIAILKRIEKITPGRRDVEERLAHLIQEKTRAAPSNAPARVSSAPAFGLEEFDPSADPLGGGGAELGMEAGPGPDSSAESLTPEPVIELMPEPVIELTPEPEPEVLPTVAADSDEDLAYLAAAEEELAPPKGGDAMVSTPLFHGLSEHDLAAVIHGLELLTFEPGDILVAEGAPGDSLFILSTGSVKAYVRNPKGHYTRVHTLVEGDFFGEISALTGKPRTATLVAAVDCEVLELKKKNLDEITATHPQVREVLKKFHEERARSTIDAMMKKKSK